MADEHAVLQICGVMDANQRQRIVNEGFATLDDLALLEKDEDVSDMAKRLASRPAAQRVLMTTVQIKNIQSLAWWVRDKSKHGQPLVAADFNAAALAAARDRRIVEGAREDKKLSISDLKKFDPDEFEECEEAVLNFFSQCYGAT